MTARRQQIFAPYRPCSPAGEDAAQCGAGLPNRGPNRLDGHQQNTLAQRRSDKAMPLIETDGLVVDCMHDDGTSTSNLRCRSTAAECVDEQITPKTNSLKARGDGKPRYQKQRDSIGHALAQFCRRQRRPLLHCGGDGVISDHLPRPVGIAHDIGARRSPFADEGALDEPLIERGVTPVVECGDLMIGIQVFWWRNAADGHEGGRCVWSAIPEWLALHQLFKSWRGRRGRIKQRQELFMAFGVQKEGALIEDRGFGFPTSARQHELGKLLPAQGSGPAEQRFQFGCGPDLDDVILSRRGAPVGLGVLCHGAKLLGGMWQFATTMSIQFKVPRGRFSAAGLSFATIIASFSPVGAQVVAQPAETSKQGYWWYETPPPPAPPPTDDTPVEKPAIPPMAQLATWSPARIHKLIESQRDYAATVLTVDAVADFWRLEDFARRKARAFAGVTQLAMLEHPELNSKSANPMVGDARDQLLAVKDDTRRVYLRAHANEFGLVMFSRSSCGYCRVEWPIVQRFRDEMGWQVTLMDLDQRPDLKERFGVDVTPTTMIIRRNSQQRLVIAAGVEAYPNLAQMTYQAVRLLTGDIRPEQFMTGAGEEGGFFDALSLGPVAASDPGAKPSEPINRFQGDQP